MKMAQVGLKSNGIEKMNTEKLTESLYKNRMRYTTAFYEHEVATNFYNRLSGRVFHKQTNDGSEESREKYEKLKEVCKEILGIQLKAARKLYIIEEEFDNLIDDFNNEQKS